MSKIFGIMCVLGKVSGRCGVSPLERVADKTTKRKKASCLEGGFLKRLGLGARERLLPIHASKEVPAFVGKTAGRTPPPST